MNNKARVTLRDIAHQANVSVSTVSRALNNHQYVDETTRQAIYQVAESLGYPLKNLRTASSDSAYSVALLSLNRNEKAQSSNDFEHLVLEGVRAELEARNIHVGVRRLWLDGRNLPDIWNETGVIWLGGTVDRDFIAEAQDRRLPCVLLGSHALPLHTNCVMADYAHGMAKAVDHLVSQGRKNIGFVNGPTTTSSSAEKFNGILTALFRHNRPFRAEQMVQVTTGWFNAETGYRKTRELLNQFPAADAIIYFDDNSAMGGLTALKEAGRRIPDDIAVIGFHDYELSRFTDPPLTTIHFDMRLMGQMAAQRLCTMIEQADNTCWTFLAPTKLIVRNST